MDKININQYQPRRAGNFSEFVSAENQCRHIGLNPERNQIRQFKLDGEVLDAKNPAQRCDYLLLNDTKQTAYYIELKGSDLVKAIAQIEASVEQITSSIQDYTVFRRIVYRTGTHKLQDRQVLLWRKKHGPKAMIRNKQIEEII
jgi:hypothetical protein